MKKLGLILVPDNDLYYRDFYLPICISKVEEEGSLPILPCGSNHMEFIERILSEIDLIYLFINFGIDDLMLRVVDVALNKKEIRYRKIPGGALEIKPAEILYEVSQKTGISIDAMKSKSRKREIVYARFYYFRRAKKVTSASLDKIGGLVGKSHCDVLYGVKQTREVREIRERYNSLYGETDKQKKAVGSTEGAGAFSGKEERCVLSHFEVEKRKQALPDEKSFVYALLGAEPCCTGGGD